MKDFQFDDKAYFALLNLLNNQHFIDCPAPVSDATFLSDDWWLRDTAVVERVVKRKGMWEVQLIFAHYLQPKKLIKRVVCSYSNKKKAILSAQYMRRLAAKDQRGTLKINLEDFGVCYN